MSTSEPVIETFVMVEGNPMPANLQPPYHALQGAFRAAAGPTPSIVIDMSAALPIAQDLVREARRPAFVLNDAATMEAMQKADTEALSVCRTKGDQLRDAPEDPRLAAALTPEALLAAVEDIAGEF